MAVSKKDAAGSPSQPSQEDTPLRLRDVRSQLIAPFYSEHIYVRPGMVSKEKPWAQALFYVKSQAIEDRLDEIVGADNWTTHYEPWGTTRLIGRLTILGITKESTGEGGDDHDDNCGTIAEAQVFKRLFSKFGFRMFYRMPEKWGRCEKDGPKFKQFLNPDRLILEVYMAMGLKSYISESTIEAAKKREAEMRESGNQAGVESGRSSQQRSQVAAQASSNGRNGVRTATRDQVTQLQSRGMEAQLRKRYPQIQTLYDLTFQQAANELSRSSASGSSASSRSGQAS